ncbi:hypothetical protein AJ80_05759 [Polytolypa hystricis UAMH7299]|uniref:Glycosyl transferase CAP10 domain-containing protein n=1 Tax=Polytolypa hystricis (strain UAMH7299) TaxID=1447883 RepID=A0A2B7Y1B7_POLH7|nr:hypothetical protein AJ80_05759 [Polytolypa hystricis UAMH7299]
MGRPSLSRLRVIALLLLSFTGIFISSLWFGMNSQKDNVPSLLTQLIPAGHCTCSSWTNFNCTSSLADGTSFPASSVSRERAWSFQYPRDGSNIALNRSQCATAFPGLFEDVNRAAAFWESSGGITTEKLDNIPLKNGMAHAAIYNGELYILATKAAQHDHRRKIMAVLSAVYRALVAAPESVPEIEFVFSIEDKLEDVAGPGLPLWILGRKSSEESVWLFPDFGFWAWENPNVLVGTYSQMAQRIKESENKMVWSEKIPKLVWRGNLAFAPKLRRRLFEVARDQPWGDVKEVVWSRKDNFISMEDHCKYQFTAHLEGRSFSSSLKYRQACNSVVVSHKLQYIQHHHYLLRSSGDDQNFVQVERDFSDLPLKMEALLSNPERSQRIAENSFKTFHERYLTAAAEACYWRALWDGYAKVSHIMANKTAQHGLPYESFILQESSAIMNFEAVAVEA